MPTIYQASCERCSYKSDVYPNEYGAVFVDIPPSADPKPLVAGAALFGSDEASIAENEDPRFVVLAHPLEAEILAETGYTWTTLAWAGRYVRIRRVICPSCGQFFEKRKLACPPMLGCQIGCLIGLACGISVGIWNRSFLQGIGTAYGTILGFYAGAAAIGWIYTRLRFRERANKVGGPAYCPKCGNRRCLNGDSQQVFRCQQCGEMACRVMSVGMS